MSITYPEQIVVDRPATVISGAGSSPEAASAPYTPVYARSGKARNGRKAVRTWMILLPIGAVVLVGGAVAMAMGGETAEPLAAPAPIESPLVAAPMVTDPMPAASTAPEPAAPVAAVAPDPVARTVAEPRRRTPAVEPRTEPAAVTPPVAEPAPVPVGPRPYLSVVEPAPASAPPPPTPVLPPETVTAPPLN